MVRSCCSTDSFIDSDGVNLKSLFKEPESFPRKPPKPGVSLDLGETFKS